MLKRILSIVLVLVLVLTIPITAYATARTCYIYPYLSFNSKTATCKVNVTGYASTDDIDIVVKLWKGSSCLKTWTAEGTGYIFFKETYTVTRSGEYTLTADVTINNTPLSRVSANANCG